MPSFDTTLLASAPSRPRSVIGHFVFDELASGRVQEYFFVIRTCSNPILKTLRIIQNIWSMKARSGGGVLLIDETVTK